MQIIFMGTPDFAVPALLSIATAGHDVVAVYTQPPRPAGRGMALRRSPVHLEAEALGLPVRVPENLKSPAEQRQFAALEADAAVVVAYGLILPKVILNGTRYGVFNIHASLLPRWRGAAPINRAIMSGDPETGVSIMRVTPGLDEGPVCLMERVAIGPDMNAGALHDALSVIGAELMVEVLGSLDEGELRCIEQDNSLATYAAKLSNEETQIDWARPAREVHDHIRGLSPYPGAWFQIVRNGKTERVKVQEATREKGHGAPGTLLDDRLTVACSEGAVRLT
ncbi:MAG: methionyl-tRNA formyltransferase, partial [Methyloceanibacter sp.]